MYTALDTPSVANLDRPPKRKGLGILNKRLNLRAAAILLAVVVLCGAGVHFLHAYQVRSNAGILLAHAERAELEKQVQAAVNYLGRYIALVPGDSNARCKHVLLLADKSLLKSHNTFLRAYFALSRVVQLAPERDDVRRRLIELAMSPHLERFADAAAHLDKLPPDAELLGLRARCLEESAKYMAAREYYEKAIAGAPGILENYIRLANLLQAKEVEVRASKDENLQALANATIDAMVQANPKDYQAYLTRSRYRKRAPTLPADKGMVQAQIEHDIQEARKLAPGQIDVILAVADLLREKHDPEAVRGLLRDGIRQHQDDAEAWRLVQALAQVETLDGHPEAAVKCLRDGLKQIPDQVDLLWNFAHLLIQQQDKDAIRVIARLTKMGMPAAELDYLKARMLLNDSEWLGAARMLERVYPQFLRGYDQRKNWFSFSLALECNLLLGICYEQMGDPYRAAMAYDRVVVRDPPSVAGHLGLARMKWALGQLDVAEKEYRHVVRYASAPAAAWVELALLLIGHNLINEHPDWDAVRDVIDYAEQLQEERRPAQATLALLRAEVQAAQKDYDAARRGLAAVKGKDGSRPTEAWIGLASVEMQRGKTETALSILDEAGKKLGDRVELRAARARLWARKGGADAIKALAPLADNLSRFDTTQRLRLYRALAEAYSQLGAHPQAAGLWQRIIALRAKDLSSRLALFDVALLAGDTTAMDEQIVAIAKLEGTQEGSLWRYCRASQYIWQAQQGKDKRHLTEASELLKIVGERRPGWARVPLALGQIDDLRGRFDTAIVHYQRAVALGEQRPAVIQQLVRVLIDHDEVAAADKMIRRLRAQSPSLLNGLERPEAVALFYNGEKEQGLKLALKAVPPDSKNYRDHIWLGQMYWAAGQENAKDATDSLRRAVALAEQVPETWLALVHHLVRVDDKQEATKVIRQAEAKLPRDKGRIELGQCYEIIGDTDRAGKLYDAALAAQPNDAKVHYAAAAFCLRTKRVEEAESHLRRILGLKGSAVADVIKARRLLAVLVAAGGDNQKAQAALAMLDGSTGDEGGTLTANDAAADQRARVVILANQPSARKRREAIAILEGLRTRKLATADEKFLLVQLYESVGEWKKARGQLVVLLSASEDRIARTANAKQKQALESVFAGYLAYYAMKLLRRGEMTEAQPWQARLEQLERKSWRSLEIKARLLGKQGKGAEAVAFVRTAAMDDSKLLLRAAQVLEQIGQAAAARELFEKYAADKAEPWRVLSLALFLARQDRPAQALDLCEGAWQNCTPEQVANATVAVVYSAKSGAVHCDRAARRIEQAIAANPQKTALLVDLAALRRLQGRIDDSLKVLRQASARDKSSSQVRNNIAWLLALQGRADEALQVISEAMVLRGEEANLLDTRAVAYIAKGRHALAIDDLQEAVAERPTAARYFHLARAQLGAGNLAAARAAIEHGQNLGLTETSVDPLERTAYRQVLAAITRR